MNGKGGRSRRCVVFISQGLGRIVPPRAHGSIATWTYETARRLTDKQSVVLIEFGDQAFRTNRMEYKGLLCIYLPTAVNRVVNAVLSRFASLRGRLRTAERRLRRPGYASIGHNLAFIVQAAWVARRLRSDVIHVHNFSQFLPIVRMFNRSARVVIHMNCEWLSQHDEVMIARRLRAADVVMCCSGHILRKVVARFPGMERKCFIVYNGADVEHFMPSPESVAVNPWSPMQILFVGRISPEKGVHLLVDAFTKVAERFPTAHLDLVGGAGSLPADFLVSLSDDSLVRGLQPFYESDYLAEVERRIPEHLRSRVTFHGSVAQRELAGHYSRSTVFVNPSLSDAFPLTVVEAMAAGLPIVASAVGGVPESVEHEITGLLAAPDNADALADGLCRLLRDPDLRQRMGAAARERALRLFSWGAIADQAAAVYGGEARPDVGTSCSSPRRLPVQP